MSKPTYRVRVSPLPAVVDENDQLVSGALVLEIHFPSQKVETGQGSLHMLMGPGMAKVVVGDRTIRGVPLC